MAENSKTKSKNNALEDLKNIGLVLGGVVVGKLIDKGAQKILKLNPGVPLSGIEEMKKFISPAVQIVGGAAGAYFIQNKIARLTLGGVAVSGASSMVDYGIKKFLEKNQVAGIGKVLESSYVDIDNARELSVSEDYSPILPELNNQEDIHKLSLKASEDIEEDQFDEAEII